MSSNRETATVHNLEQRSATKGVKVIAVGSGKGGVGKTNVAVNLAWQLARKGEKVLLMDADLGLANVDILLGIKPKWTLADVIAGECGINDIVVPGPGGISVIPAASGVKHMAELDASGHAGIIAALSELTTSYDTMIVDMAAGIADSVVSFARASHHVLVVASREPTSIADAYALIKVLNQHAGLHRFKMLVNMADSEEQARESFARLNRVTEQFLDVSLEYAGMVPRDAFLQGAVASQSIVSEKYPGASSSRALKRLAVTAGRWQRPQHADGGAEFFVDRLLADTSPVLVEASQ